MRFAYWIALLLLLCLPALGEGTDEILNQVDLSPLQTAAEGTGVDVKATVLDILSGKTRLDADFLRQMWAQARESVLTQARGVLAALVLPPMLAAVARWTGKQAGTLARLLGGAACALSFLGLIVDASQMTRQLLQRLNAGVNAALPVLTGLSALGGGTSSAALLTPMTSLLGDILVNFLGKWGIFLCRAACVCAVAMPFAGRFGPETLFATLKNIVLWITGLTMAAFVGALKVQGMLGSTFDSAAVRTVRFAFDKMVPGAGGGISDSMDAVLSSVLLVKGAVGVTGMLVLALSCAAPVMKLWGYLLAARLAAVLAAPMGDDGILKAIRAFRDVMRMLTALMLAAAALSLILVGAGVGASGALRS